MQDLPNYLFPEIVAKYPPSFYLFV